jgi:predicted NAD/FAD-binding protein
VYEAAEWIGGHTNTVDVPIDGRHVPVDTGFIVYNDWTYPRFIELLGEIGAESQPSNMSFSVRCEASGLEYNGTSINALFAQRRNALRPSFLAMIADIVRFNGRCRELLRTRDDTLTLGQYLERGHYSRAFIDRYIVPMGKSIWSATEADLLGFPARFFVEFFDMHGFLNVNDRPTWRAIRGGSREYMRRLVAPFRHRIFIRTPVVGVRRDPEGVTVRTARGDSQRFDQVVFACHSDQALAVLDDPTAAEREILGAFRYQVNEVVLHTDERLLPRTPLARGAWNYHLLSPHGERAAVTYDMNVLQSLDCARRLLVTLNHTAAIRPDRILHRFEYHHPVYSPAAVAAQRRRREVSGVHRTFYCGAYWRYGFHEDGVVSADWAIHEFAEATGERAGFGSRPMRHEPGLAGGGAGPRRNEAR